MRRTTRRTSLDRAVFAVPASHTQTGAILALPVLVASDVAQFRVAEVTAPAVIAETSLTDASAVRAAVQVAKFWQGINQ